MKQQLYDIVLAEGNNELNVQLTPISGVGEFVYSNILCRTAPWPGSQIYAQTFLNFTVTNVGFSSETRRVTVYALYASTQDPSWYWENSRADITLAPGQSITMELTGKVKNGETVYLWIVDSKNVQTPTCVCKS